MKQKGKQSIKISSSTVTKIYKVVSGNGQNINKRDCRLNV